MSEMERLRRQAELYKSTYPPGTRILLQSMGDDPCPIEDNTRGVVDFIDDIGTLHCTFDNGRTLGIIPGEDRFRKLTPKELEEEQVQNRSLEEQIHSAESRCSGLHIAPENKEKNPEH